MTGPDHFREAERLMRDAKRDGPDGPYYMDDQMPTLAAAQVHATLALAAAAALPHLGDMWIADRREWETACSAHEDGDPE